MKEASSVVFDRWLSKADENISEWGIQSEETLLLAIQEELGELTQAYLEARAEGGDPAQIDKELDDLGALLLQFHEARNTQSHRPGTDRCECENPTKKILVGGPENEAMGIQCDDCGGEL